MHWFWRASIAVLAGIAVGSCAVYAISSHDYPGISMEIFRDYPWGYLFIATSTTLAAYKMLTDMMSDSVIADCRCRRCQYILKGISEPICPECGERI